MARLQVRQGINSGMYWDLGEGITVVGRDLRNTVCLTDLRVSRKHFQIEKIGSAWVARNLSATNGTFVDGEAITEKLLRQGDQISIGDTVMEFLDEVSASSVELRGGDTVAWMPAEEDRLHETRINYTVRVQDSTVSNLTGETDARRLKVMNERLAMLQELSNALTKEFEEEKLFQTLLDRILSVIEGDTGSILMADRTTQTLSTIVTRERGKGSTSGPVNISRSIVSRAINEKIAILTADARSDERFRDQESIIMSDIRSALCVPMIAGEQVLGIIHLDSRTAANSFTQDDLKLLTMIANQAAVSLHNARLRDSVATEKAQRKLLSRYLSPNLLDHLVHEAAAEALKARKVHVTVLFCDIRGFTPLSERLQPEEVMELLNMYCTQMAETVFKHNGTIDKYIGDCVMAVFGGLSPEPRHARRAVACAVEMQERVEKMRVGGRPVHAGVGIHTGSCVQGNVGSDAMMQFTAVGDTVNTASRLCGFAKPGTIVISELTLQACGGALDVELIGEAELKGKSERIKTYKVNGLGDLAATLAAEHDSFDGDPSALSTVRKPFPDPDIVGDETPQPQNLRPRRG